MRCLLAVAVVAACATTDHEVTIDQPISTQVTTTAGRVIGYADDGLVVFKGIPYAAAPTGARRWKPPQPIAWSAPRVATADPEPCPQPAVYKENANAGVSGATGVEDCLNLNVWAHAAGANRPVMVFIHGGSGIVGGHTDAEALARASGNVVVTVQYRLGALGHLAMPELGHGNGNFALLDQQAALRWVASNIGAFGGDRTRVMLFGESEGSHYTCTHTVAPASFGLFHAAIAQSGTCNELPAVAATFETWRTDVIQEVGCAWGRLACMRGVPAAQLVAATSQAAMTMVVDSDVVPRPPGEAWVSGERADVPLVIGTNRDEASFFLALYAIQYPYLIGAIDSWWGYDLAVRVWQPARANELLALYPYARYGSGLRALNEMITDVTACTARAWARAWDRGGGTAWQYEFVATVGGLLSILGSTHGLELAFVFDAWTTNDVEPTPDERALVDWMQDAWAHVARATMPGAEWPVFDGANPRHLEIGFARAVRAEFRGGRCEALVDAGVVKRFD